MKIFTHIVIISFIAVLTSCKTDTHKETDMDSSEVMIKESALNNLPKSEAGEIVNKAIESAGGMINWEKKNSISFYKTIKFFDSTGNQLREVKQLHEYQLKPELKIKMSWEENGDKLYIINKSGEAKKFKNGEQMMSEEDKNSAWNSSFGSHYVSTMPFKLTDDGTIMEYTGIDTLENRPVHKIRTTYKENAGSSGGMHIWIYYFDKDTYEPAGNFLDYGDGFSLIINESLIEVDGIKLLNNRKSYKTNAEQEILYLTTEYSYGDYQFDKKFKDDYFEFN